MEASRRRDRILEAVERDGYASMSALTEEFGVAPVTIHRDLDQLESQGALERVHGGARSLTGRASIRTDFGARQVQMAAEKTAIARRAMAEIPDGATIFLDSSTTTLAMLPFLEREPARGLTLVTSSPSIAAQLVAPHIHTIVVPGELNQSLRALTGRWTIEFLERLSFGVAFVSSAGITAEGGLSTTQRELAEVTRAAFAQAGRRIALVDSTKFGVSALLTIDSPIDLVITDNHLAGHTISEFGAAGVRIVQAGDEE